MPNPQPSVEQGGFTLVVHFTGICLYAFDGNTARRRAVVLLPDARVDTKNPDVEFDENMLPTHADGTSAEPHAAFLRFDVSHLFPPDSRDGRFGDPRQNPEFEVVHLLDRQRVLFDGAPAAAADAGPMSAEQLEQRVPDTREYAPILEPRPDAFAPRRPTRAVLARVDLEDGEFLRTAATVKWRIESPLVPRTFPGQKAKAVCEGNFVSTVTWKKRFAGEHLTLVARHLDADAERLIRLYPTREGNDVMTITLTVANLCKDNPLEWDALAPPNPKPQDDHDFKWLFRLLRLKKGEGTGVDFGAPLPFPKPVDPGSHGDLQGCTGTRTLVDLDEVTAAGEAEIAARPKDGDGRG